MVVLHEVVEIKEVGYVTVYLVFQRDRYAYSLKLLEGKTKRTIGHARRRLVGHVDAMYSRKRSSDTEAKKKN